MSTPLSIRPGVYFAAVQGEGVIMDLVEDRYYGLGAQSAGIWRDVFERASAPGIVAPPASPDIVARQLEAWRQARLVTAGPEVPADLPALKPVGEPAAVGLDDSRMAQTRISWLALLRLIRAGRWSRRALKQHGICWTLKRLQQIPARPARPGAVEDVHRMMRVYRSSRRVVNQGKDDCLPRSLALVAALRGLGVDAEVCFGVRKFPFLAHAWVEADGRVINETPAKVQAYTLLARF